MGSDWIFLGFFFNDFQDPGADICLAKVRRIGYYSAFVTRNRAGLHNPGAHRGHLGARIAIGDGGHDIAAKGRPDLE